MENIILGAVQGIAEWLPVSSEGILILTKINIYNSSQPLPEIIKEVLFLHLGTFFAALVYFRKDVKNLFNSVFNFKNTDKETKNLLLFLVISTVISGAIGGLLLKLLENISINLETAGKVVSLAIGLLLIVTGSLQLKTKNSGKRKIMDLKTSDGAMLGIVQGLASFPGLSRSGTTVSALLFKKFDKKTALKLSFLMSLPIVFAGNIILNINDFSLTRESLIGLLSSFIFGIGTIHLLLKLAQKINFGKFVIGFGLLTLLSVFA